MVKRGRVRWAAFVLAAGNMGFGQAGPASTAAGPAAPIETQVAELREMLRSLQTELAESRRESAVLKQELVAIREQIGSAAPPGETAGPSVSALAEEQQLISAKVDDQYQTKVESASKNRVQLSGIALFTMMQTSGDLNSLDVPMFVGNGRYGSAGGAFAASMRQSMLGLDVAGPTLFGARTQGQIRMDFFGSIQGLPDGIATGTPRFRTGGLRLDWTNHSLVAAQEAPFISPLSPSSLLSNAYPALAGAGNLWSWIPQVYWEHRHPLSDSSKLLLQAGILDPHTGEIPTSEYQRLATAGERSRQPAYALRLGWQRSVANQRQASLAIGTYYSRQNWGFWRRVDSWAVTADWDLPLTRKLALSGEMYRGRAIAGLGGGIGGSILRSGSLNLRSTRIIPIESAGGWAQLKLKATRQIEFNGAYGFDAPFSRYRRGFPFEVTGEDYKPMRNASGLFNIIYQPRNNLLFSIEYRKLWTTPLDEVQRNSGHHLGIGAGVLF